MSVYKAKIATAAGILVGTSLHSVPVVEARMEQVTTVHPVRHPQRQHVRQVTAKVSRYKARTYARIEASKAGYNSRQYACLVRLWHRESRWNYKAENKATGAYGIPQRMGSKSNEYRNDYEKQIQWGLGYIKSRYGTPCRALDHSLRHNWY